MESYNSQTPLPPAPIKNWLVESILATIFCCLPAGIVGIIYANRVNGKIAAGDYDGALADSKEAARWTKISFFISIGIFVLVTIFLFAFGGWALLQSRDRDY